MSWVIDGVETVAREFPTTEGGKIITSLGASGSPFRQDIANALVAALGQRRMAEAHQYLAELAGNPNAPQGDVELDIPTIDAERPVLPRPNGSKYYARKWNKFWDVDVLKKARETQQFVLLLGPPGTGKTAMAEAAFGDELITTVVTGDTMVGGLVGGFIPDGKGGYLWIDGPLLKAVREGRPILIDEILLANPVVLSVLYPLMDGRGFLDVQENPEIGSVQAADGFFILGAANPNVPGAKLSEALGSRFAIHVEVTTDWELAKALGVHPRVVEIVEGLALRAAGRNSSISWAPQFRELLAFKALEDIWGREFAINNLMALVPKADLNEVMAEMAPLLGMDRTKPAKI